MQTTATKSLFLTALLSTLAGMPQAQAVTRGFFAAKPVPGATEEFAKKILVADFNGDGKPDFATLHWEIDNRGIVNGVNYEKGFLVRVYLNTTPPGSRDSSFQLSAELPYVHGEYRMYDVWDNDMILDDVNADGKLDIVVANAHNDVIETYLGKGNGQFNPPVESVVDDDPTYIATGHFATTAGFKQLYIQHYKRNDWTSGNYNLFSSLYQYNKDGLLTKIGTTLDDSTGNWRYSNGPYYAFSGNKYTAVVPKNSVVLSAKNQAESISSDGSDVVLQTNGWSSNGNPQWLHSVTAGNLYGRLWYDHNNPTLFDKWMDCPSSGPLAGCYMGSLYSSFYSPTHYAFNAGAILKTLLPVNSLWATADYDYSLERFTSGKVLKVFSPFQLGYFGSAVLADDLDQDGQTDLLALSDELYSGVKTDDDPEKPHNIEQAILVAYGISTDEHPLNVDPAIGFDTDRIKLLTNASGRWYAGLHDWHWALSDFNGDGYKDLITLTDSGVMVHTNYGNFAQEAVPPVLNDMSINTIKPGATITVNGNFRTGDRLANWIELTDRTMGRDPTKYLLAASPVPTPANSNAPITQMTCIVPADKINPGTYELRVTNTLARSTRFLILTVQ